MFSLFCANKACWAFAAHLAIPIFYRKISSAAKDLFKGCREGRKRNKYFSSRQDSNPSPFDFEASVLPLCFKRFSWLLFKHSAKRLRHLLLQKRLFDSLSSCCFFLLLTPFSSLSTYRSWSSCWESLRHLLRASVKLESLQSNIIRSGLKATQDLPIILVTFLTRPLRCWLILPFMNGKSNENPFII